MEGTDVLAFFWKGGGTERESNPPLPATLSLTTTPGCAPTLRFLFPSLAASAGRAVSTLRHFPNLHEGMAPGLHPFGDGIPMVRRDLPDRAVCKPEARDVAFRRQPVLQMRDGGIRHEERPPNFQERGRLDDLHVPPKMAGAVPKVPVPAAARPRLELHGERPLRRRFLARPQLRQQRPQH